MNSKVWKHVNKVLAILLGDLLRPWSIKVSNWSEIAEFEWAICERHGFWVLVECKTRGVVVKTYDSSIESGKSEVLSNQEDIEAELRKALDETRKRHFDYVRSQ